MAHSSRNARKHGLYAKLHLFTPEQATALHDESRFPIEAFRPAGPVALAIFQLRRIDRIEIDFQTRHPRGWTREIVQANQHTEESPASTNAATIYWNQSEAGTVSRTATILLLACCSAGAQDFSEVTVEKVATGYRFTEGPVWSPEGLLFFSDVPNSRIYRWTPGQPAEVFRQDRNFGNGNALDAQARLYTCESISRRVVRTDKKGKIEVLAERFEGKRFNAPNDIVVRRDGHLWFTDPAFGGQTDTRELDFNGVYHLPPKGPLELVAGYKTRPNGITLAPKGQILYVADSDAKCVRAWDLDRQGKATNERIAVSNIVGVPDGLRTDEKGNLYVATDAIAVYSPAGKLLVTIEIPEKASNCAFGDADYQTLFVTAETSVYRVRLSMRGSIEH